MLYDLMCIHTHTHAHKINFWIMIFRNTISHDVVMKEIMPATIFTYSKSICQ